MLIVGTRPNFIKALSVYKELENRGFEVIVIHTGQHYDNTLSNDVYKELQLPITLNMNIKTSNKDRITIKLIKVINKYDPNFVVVFGDVNSTFAATLAAKKCNKKVAHIEAGLRSGDYKMEEEYNRYLIDALSDLLFVTEEEARKRLGL